MLWQGAERDQGFLSCYFPNKSSMVNLTMIWSLYIPLASPNVVIMVGKIVLLVWVSSSKASTL